MNSRDQTRPATESEKAKKAGEADSVRGKEKIGSKKRRQERQGMGADPGLSFREVVTTYNTLITPRLLVVAMCNTATTLRRQVVAVYNALAT